MPVFGGSCWVMAAVLKVFARDGLVGQTSCFWVEYIGMVQLERCSFCCSDVLDVKVLSDYVKFRSIGGFGGRRSFLQCSCIVTGLVTGIWQ